MSPMRPTDIYPPPVPRKAEKGKFLLIVSFVPGIFRLGQNDFEFLREAVIFHAKNGKCHPFQIYDDKGKPHIKIRRSVGAVFY